MERIYYDTYENRIRVTVWADTGFDGSLRIHNYTCGVYIDDIFGMDEDETFAVIPADSVSDALAASGVSSLKELLVYFDNFARFRDGYERVKSWLEKEGVSFTEETL